MNNRAIFGGDANRISDLSVFTLVIWTGCFLVGGLGFALPYARRHPLEPQPEPVKVEMLDVKLADDPPAASELPMRPSVLEPGAQLQVPQLIPVAQPSPAIAFALPVAGPVRVVEKQKAAYAQPLSTTVAAAAPAPQPLTFGIGEGRQPSPEYPARARREGQEGVVTIRFTVARDGHVIAAEVIAPSGWPLLNDSALHAVKDRWHFSPGKFRAYDVSIRFELAR